MLAAEHPIDPEELNEYLDGELPLDRAAAVQAHVAGCAACQKISVDLRSVSRDLAAWTVEKAPDSLEVKNMSARSTTHRHRSWRPRWLSASLAIPTLGLSTAGVVLLVLGLGQQKWMSAPGSMAQVGRATSASSGSIPTATVLTPSAAPARESLTVIPLGGVAQGEASLAAPASHVIRTAMLRVVPKDFDASRARLDTIVAGAGGLLGDVNVTGLRTEARALKATVRVPAARFDRILAELKGLGEVTHETMSANDVTNQVVDLEARLTNTRNTEQRMNEILRTRTGKLSDVLEAEREVSRVREEIERLAAQRKNIAGQVAYGSITLTMEEAPKSSITRGPLPLSLRLRNALVDGLRAAFESGVGAVLFFLQLGPFLILWVLVLGLPIRFVWRRFARA